MYKQRVALSQYCHDVFKVYSIHQPGFLNAFHVLRGPVCSVVTRDSSESNVSTSTRPSGFSTLEWGWGWVYLNLCSVFCVLCFVVCVYMHAYSIVTMACPLGLN